MAANQLDFSEALAHIRIALGHDVYFWVHLGLSALGCLIWNPYKITAAMGSTIIDDETFASSDITIPVPSATTQSLIALSQDITALLSLSIETTASIVHDAYRKAIGAIGLGEVVAQRSTNCTRPGGEASRGLAVVVVGAGEGVSAYTGSPPSQDVDTRDVY